MNTNSLRLKNSLAELNITEEVGKETLVELQKQRESLTKVKDNLNEANKEVTYSNSVLNRILRRSGIFGLFRS